MEKTIRRHYHHHVSSSSPMRFRFPILTRINPTNRIILHPHNRHLYPKILSLKLNMADQSEAEKSAQSAINKEEVKLAPPPKPVPPEKPLPGDCCGSGCVRCVWDIYFDELDEYDKLCKIDTDSLPNPKTS